MMKSSRDYSPRVGQGSAVSVTSQIWAFGKQQASLDSRSGRRTRPSSPAAETLPIPSLSDFLLVPLCGSGSASSDVLLDIAPSLLPATWERILFCSYRWSRSLAPGARSHRLPGFAITALSISQSSKDRCCLSLPSTGWGLTILYLQGLKENLTNLFFFISDSVHTVCWPPPTAPLLGNKPRPTYNSCRQGHHLSLLQPLQEALVLPRPGDLHPPGALS